MKIKHIQMVHIGILAVLITLFCLTSCVKEKPYDCRDIAINRFGYHKEKGDRVRMCRGSYDAIPHMWVEVYNESFNVWIKDDPAIKYGKESKYVLISWIENGTIGTK